MVTITAIQHKQFNLTSLIYLHLVKWSNSSIWSMDGTLSGTTTPGQSEPMSNSNERVLHIPQSSRTGTSPPDSLVPYRGHLFESYPLRRDAVAVFYCLGVACGVMVIVVGNGHATRVQTLDENDCISHCSNTFGKGMNPIILPPAMGK